MNVFDLYGTEEKVRVAFNLHKKKLSVRRGGKVIEYVDVVNLKDVKFVVQSKGHQRCVDQKQKNLHAFVEGKLAAPHAVPGVLDMEACLVRYNPYESDHFFRADTGEQLSGAYYMLIEGETMVAYGPQGV